MVCIYVVSGSEESSLGDDDIAEKHTISSRAISIMEHDDNDGRNVPTGQTVSDILYL